MVLANIVTPTKAYISGPQEELEEIRKQLTYENTSAKFVYNKHKKNKWFKQKNPAEWEAHGKRLKADIEQCAMYEDGGGLYIRPGSISYIQHVQIQIGQSVQLPTPKPVPWYKPLPFSLHEDQIKTVESLLKTGHGNVEIATGVGKTACILSIAQKLGLKTIIFTPSQQIFNEMLKEFQIHFGPNMVGALGDGYKKFGKRFTVCVSKSLSMLKPGTKEYDEIASADVMLGDESHTIPASTLEAMCHGVLGNIPYRFFFSGTQTRGDGTEVALQSIIGKTVHTLDTAEAVRKKYICDHKFTIVDVNTSNPKFNSFDPLENKRVHFLDNDNIAKFAAKIANAMATIKGEQTLILVEEISQIANIIKYLTVPYVYATGTMPKKTLLEYGLENNDTSESVDKFNNGEAKVIVGTRCISTGTNMFPTHHTINWQGGASEIATKQGPVGRSVRKLETSKFAALHKPKPFAMIWDFNVVNIPILRDQLDRRLRYYRDSGTEIRFLNEQK